LNIVEWRYQTWATGGHIVIHPYLLQLIFFWGNRGCPGRFFNGLRRKTQICGDEITEELTARADEKWVLKNLYFRF